MMSLKILIKSNILILFTLYSITAIAAEETTGLFGGWSFDGSIETISLDSDQADQELIKDRATAIGVYINYSQGHWLTTISSSYIFYSDHGEFSQTVEGEGLFNDGDIETASSDAGALTLGIASGRLWRFGTEKKWSGALQLGYDGVFGSERSISNCRNCYSEDIDIDGGPFVRGTLKHSFGGVSVGVLLSQYLTSDGLAHSLGLVVGSRL